MLHNIRAAMSLEYDMSLTEVVEWQTQSAHTSTLETLLSARIIAILSPHCKYSLPVLDQTSLTPLAYERIGSVISCKNLHVICTLGLRAI